MRQLSIGETSLEDVLGLENVKESPLFYRSSRIIILRFESRFNFTKG